MLTPHVTPLPPTFTDVTFDDFIEPAFAHVALAADEAMAQVLVEDFETGLIEFEETA